MHHHFVVEQTKIHCATFLRDPNNPEIFLREDPPTNGTFMPVYPVIVSFPPPNAQRHIKEYSKRIGENACSICNSQPVQSRFSYPGPRTQLQYVGDVTPLHEEEYPKLSKFLTIKDVWQCIMQLYRDPETHMEPPAEEILQDEDLLLQYYDADLLPLVRQRYGPREEVAAAQETEIKISSMDDLM